MFDFFKKKKEPDKAVMTIEPPMNEESVQNELTVTITPEEDATEWNGNGPEPEVIGENVQVFAGEFGSVRVLTKDGDPWFVGKDVAEALGYKETAKAIRDHVDAEDKGVSKMDTPGGKQAVTFINESGLYSLVLSSQLPSAKQFKRWVTSEILPSIRKHGAYMTAQTIDNIIADPGNFMKLVSALNDERQNVQKLTEQNATLVINNNRLEWENDGLTQKIEQDAPKVAFADSFKNAEGSITINELAKLLTDRGYETGEKRLYETLRNEGYLMKGGKNHNLPTQRANSMSVPIFTLKSSSYIGTDGTMHPTCTTYVTPAGQTYFFRHFCGENFRVSDPLTPEQIAQKQVEYHRAIEEGRKRGWTTIQKSIEDCAANVRKIIVENPGETYWASMNEIKSAIPETEKFSKANFGIAMKRAGVEMKVTWVSSPKKTTVTRYAMPKAIFNKAIFNRQNLEQTPPPIDIGESAQEKKPNTSTMTELMATVRDVLLNCEKKGMKRQFMTVEAFKWAHPEFADVSVTRLESALANVGIRFEKQDGIRLYKVF